MTPTVTHDTAAAGLAEARTLHRNRTIDFLNAWRGLCRAGLDLDAVEPTIRAVAVEMARIAREARR